MAKFHQTSLFSMKEQKRESTFLSLPRSLSDFANNFYNPSCNPNLLPFILEHISPEQSIIEAPLQENISAGKNTSVYDAHTYHTKVPPKAIKQLIEYYTKPGDIVLDPFCGSGMTGVAALEVHRKPILNDLSPAATFIAVNFLTPVYGKQFMKAVESVLSQVMQEELELFGTHCRTCGKLVPMEYAVWSYSLVCPICHNDFVLWDVARDERDVVKESKIKVDFDCPHCQTHLEKRTLKRSKINLVEVGYHCCNSRTGRQETRAVPDEYDLRLVEEINNADFPGELWYPDKQIPDGVNTRQPISHGFKTLDSLYTRRSLRAVARLWDLSRKWPDESIGLKLMFTVTSLYQRVTRLSEFRFWGGSGNIANYSVPMIFNEQNVYKVFYRKAKTINLYLETWNAKPDMPFCITTQSATNLQPIPDNSIDYVFTDPPFGGNINYSEMNFLWESWLGVFTDNSSEAIVNKVQNKTIKEYQGLMTQAIREIRRVLKPNGWLNLVFHNSSSIVWRSIQESLIDAGFTIETIQTLDKKHGTFKQFVSDNAVGYDLIIHCKKQVEQTNGNHSLTVKKISEEELRDFITQTVMESPDEYIVRYMHVNRASELDCRKLYSFWLKKTMEAEEVVDIDYEQFRRMAVSALSAEFGDLLIRSNNGDHSAHNSPSLY